MPRRWTAFRIGRLDLRCLAVVLAFRLLLSVFGYRRIRPWLRRTDPASCPAPGHSIFYARQVAGSVRYAARFVPGALCLAQSLSVQYLLARSGHHVDVHVGVAPLRDVTEGHFSAHAWVECGGVPLAETDDPADFVPLLRLG